MQYGDFIDSLADLRKVGIETSGLSRDDKEMAKAGVDCLASALKAVSPFPEQNRNTLNINFEWIRLIKETASRCSAEKVVLFPYFVNQNLIPVMRVYGGDKNRFCEETGQRPLTTNTAECVDMAQWEKEYGILLYER